MGYSLLLDRLSLHVYNHLCRNSDMKETRHRFKVVMMRGAPVLWVASFLFFLIYSQPHRVHHFFEQFPEAHQQADNHHHPATDHHNRRSNDANCVFQVSASRCHLNLAAQVSPEPPPLWISPVDSPRAISQTADFRPAVFHIRAPPLA
jgi:hypothetical protein